MKSKKAVIVSIDEYIATFPPDVQKKLEEVRATIKSAAPQTEEKISYGMPTFTLDSKYLIYFAGWKEHISLYPIPTGDEAFNEKLAPYTSGRGTVKFPLAEPMPLKLITKMVKLRLAENLEYRQRASTKTTKGKK